MLSLVLRRFRLCTGLILFLTYQGSISPVQAQALPPATDLPEEILSTEIIVEARSGLDGRPLPAVDYAQQQGELRSGDRWQPRLVPSVQEAVINLRLRKLLKSIFPFF